MRAALTLGLTVLALFAGALALWLVESTTPAPTGGASPSAVAAETRAAPRQPYVLAVSWHPAFCETKPGLEECRLERASDYAADHFSLHGLWPQEVEYCGISQRIVDTDRAGRWLRLPEIEVSAATRRDLAQLMPGSRDGLERHEWTLHGSCAGVSAETYFSRALALTDELNASSVRDLLAANIGKRLTSGAIRAAFDDAFGSGAGRKVRLDCARDGKRDLLVELRINLDGDVMGSAGLGAAISQARSISAGCQGGIVDRAGQQ